MSTMALKRSISVTMETQSALDLRNQPMKRARTEPMVTPVTPERVQKPLSCPMAPKKCAKPLVLENITEADPVEIEEHETNGTMDELINREPRTIPQPVFDGILTQAVQTDDDFDTRTTTIGVLLSAAEQSDHMVMEETVPIDLTSQSTMVQESQEDDPIDLTVSQPVDNTTAEVAEVSQPVDNTTADNVAPAEPLLCKEEQLESLDEPEDAMENAPVWKSMSFDEAHSYGEPLFFRFESYHHDEDFKPFTHSGIWDGLFDLPKEDYEVFMNTIRLRMLGTPFAKERELTMEDFENDNIRLISYNLEHHDYY